MARRRKTVHRTTRRHHKAITPKAKISQVIRTLHVVKDQIPSDHKIPHRRHRRHRHAA